MPHPNRRIPGEVVLSDLTFKKVSVVDKLILSMKYGNGIPDFINNNTTIAQSYEWYENDIVQNVEIIRIYNNIQSYADFLVGK